MASDVSQIPGEQGDGLVMGQTAAHTFSLLEAVMAETLGMALHNAVRTQSQMQMVNGAAVVASCARMLRVAPPAPPDPPAPPNPPPPAPAPAPSSSSSGGLASRIAQDSVRLETAIGAMLQSSQTASADLDAATAALRAVATQVTDALEPPATERYVNGDARAVTPGDCPEKS